MLNLSFADAARCLQRVPDMQLCPFHASARASWLFLHEMVCYGGLMLHACDILLFLLHNIVCFGIDGVLWGRSPSWGWFGHNRRPVGPGVFSLSPGRVSDYGAITAIPASRMRVSDLLHDPTSAVASSDPYMFEFLSAYSSGSKHSGRCWQCHPCHAPSSCWGRGGECWSSWNLCPEIGIPMYVLPGAIILRVSLSWFWKTLSKTSWKKKTSAIVLAYTPSQLLLPGSQPGSSLANLD